MASEQLDIERTKMARATFSRLGFGLLTAAVISLTLQLGINIVTPKLEACGIEIASKTWLVWLFNFAPLYLFGIPAGILVMNELPTQTYAPVRIGFGNLILLMLMCFPMMYGGSLLGNLLSTVLSGGSGQNPILEFAFDSSPMKVVVLVILAPLIEEYLFRKQLIDRSIRYGEATAILFSALMFALFHMNLYQFFYTFGIGLVFGYTYTHTHRLRDSVIMHMIVNLLGSVVAPALLSSLDLSAIQELASGQMEESAVLELLPQLAGFSVYVLLILGLSIAGLVILITKLQKITFQTMSDDLPRGSRFRTTFCNSGVIAFALFCAAVCVMILL